MSFSNVYSDSRRAQSYAQLEFPGTYYLAYRDLPAIIAEHVTGKRALDFGCGAGRSTRFLRALGFHATGVDISESMIRQAQERDPKGDYHMIADDGMVPLREHAFDLVLSAFTFDNIPTAEKKASLFRALHKLLTAHGKIVNLVSSPDIYLHEWASFSTREFAGNFTARTGDYVYTKMLDVDDQRPVQDVLWPDDAYRETYKEAGLEIVHTYKPLALPSEPYPWVNETRVAPWVIYVLAKSSQL